MSAPVSYEKFCSRYELDPAEADSRQQYDEYCENLDFTNQVFAEHETKEAVERMKNS